MVQPLFYYAWVQGESLKIGAIIRNGKTLYGPVPVVSLTPTQRDGGAHYEAAQNAGLDY